MTHFLPIFACLLFVLHFWLETRVTRSMLPVWGA